MSRLGSSFKRWISIAVMVGLIVTSLPVSAMAETTTDSGSVAVTDISGTNGGSGGSVVSTSLSDDDQTTSLNDDDQQGDTDGDGDQPGSNGDGDQPGSTGDDNLPSIMSNSSGQRYIKKTLELEADHVLYDEAGDGVNYSDFVPITSSGSSKVYLVFKRGEGFDGPFDKLWTLENITSVRLEFEASKVKDEDAFTFNASPLDVKPGDSLDDFNGINDVAPVGVGMLTKDVCAQSNGVENDGVTYSIDVLRNIAEIRASDRINIIDSVGYYGYAISLVDGSTAILCGENSKPKLVITYEEIEEEDPDAKTIAAADSMLAARQSIQATLEGSGTVSDPYLIYDAYDLCGMTENDNSCYKLMNDIDLKGIDWRPPGYYYWYPFMGYLDGNGHTIKNLHMGGSSSDAWDINAGGLFGYLEGRVENLHVETVKAKRKGIDFFGYAGGIAGIAVAPAEIINCSVNGYISGNNAAGGLVGIAYPGVIIESCCAIGSVDMSDAYAYLNDNGSKLTKVVWDSGMDVAIYLVKILCWGDEIKLAQAQGKSKFTAFMEALLDKAVSFPLDSIANTEIQKGLRRCSIGGLVGMNMGEIYNSYASVDLYNPQNQLTELFDWDGDGEVNGAANSLLSNNAAKTGGLVGRQIDGYGGAVNCYYNKDRYNNVDDSKQGIEKTTAGLKNVNLFGEGKTIYGASAKSQWDYSVKLKSTGGLPLPKCNYVSRAKKGNYEPDIYYDSRVLMKTRENFIIGADVIKNNGKQYIKKGDYYYEINNDNNKANSYAVTDSNTITNLEKDGNATGAIYCTYCDELEELANAKPKGSAERTALENQIAVTGRFQRGSDARPYHVHDLASLLAMQDSKESHFILCTDIDFKVSNGDNKTIQKYWWPAGKTHFSPIKGSLKGNVCYQDNDSTIYGDIKPITVDSKLKRFTIKNLTVQHNRFVGLFASFRGTFSDINIQLSGGNSRSWRDGIRCFDSNGNCENAGLFAVGKNGAAGAVAGETVNGALIRNCIVTGPWDGNLSHTPARGRIKGAIRSGGITGMNNRGSKIEGCEALVYIDPENYEIDYRMDMTEVYLGWYKAIVGQADEYANLYKELEGLLKSPGGTSSIKKFFKVLYGISEVSEVILNGSIPHYLRSRYGDVCIGGLVGDNFGTIGENCIFYTQSTLDSGNWVLMRGWSYHVGSIVGRGNIKSTNDNSPKKMSINSSGSSFYYSTTTPTAMRLAGAGSEEEPMVVRTEDDLKQLAEVIQQNGLQGTYVKQSKDIVLSDGSDFKGFTGTFKGVYDGNGCTISGVASDKPLFEKLEGAVIKNLGVKNSSFSGKAAFVEEAKDSIIQNCWIERTVTIGSENGDYASGFADILDNSSVFNVYNYGKLSAKLGICGIAREMKGSSYIASCLVDMQKLSTTCWDYSLAYKVGEGSEFINCLWVPSSTMRKTGDDKRSQEEQSKEDGCRALTGSETSEDFMFDLFELLNNNAEEAQKELNEKTEKEKEISFTDEAFWNIGDVDDESLIMKPVLRSFTMKYEGNGTENYPYLIKDSEDFDYFARKLAAGAEMENLYFKQTVDITVSKTASQDLEEASETKFKGNYDGDYHTLSGIVINNIKKNDGTTNAALFGAAEGATVKNLGIIDSSFSAATAAPFIANGRSGLVYDEEYNSTQKDVIIQNCWTGDDVEITGTINAGGIAGSIASTQIYHCANYGTVDGANCGGIAAVMSKGQIAGCISGGTIKGNANYRFANLIQSTCNDSFFVTATGSGEDNISPTELRTSEFIEKLNSIAAEEETTGLGTWAIAAEGEGPIPTEIPVVNTASDIEDEEDVVPTTQVMRTSSVPVIRVNSDSTSIAGDHSDFSGGNGTADAPYEIRTIEELDRVKHYLKSGYHFKLMANLNFKDYKGNWVSIGTDPDYSAFQGVFDGNGKKIEGLDMYSSASAGLFGYCAGTVKNLKVVNSHIDTTGQAAGVIVAVLCAGGRVEQCAVINSSTNSAHYSGGIVGEARKGSIINNVYGDNVYASLSHIFILNSGEDGLLGGSREPSSVNGGFTDVLSVIEFAMDELNIILEFFKIDSSSSGLSYIKTWLQEWKNGNSGARTAAAGGIVGFLGGSLSNSWVERENNVFDSLSTATSGLFSAYQGEIVGREFYGKISGKNYTVDRDGITPVGSGVQDSYKNNIVEIDSREPLTKDPDNGGITFDEENTRWTSSDGIYELNIFVMPSNDPKFEALASLDHEIIAEVPEIDPADGYYKVRTVNELAYIEFEGWSNYKLMNDIDLTGYNWVPLCRERDQYFDGTFDGQGHTIYGLHVETDENGGLFGFVLGTVKDLNIGVDVVDAYLCAGGLAAGVYYRGQISRVSVVDNDIAIAMAVERMMQGKGDDEIIKLNESPVLSSLIAVLLSNGVEVDEFEQSTGGNRFEYVDPTVGDIKTVLERLYLVKNETFINNQECHYGGKTHIIGGGNEDGAGVGGLVGVVGKDVVIKDCYTRLNVSNANFVLLKELDLVGIKLEIASRILEGLADILEMSSLKPWSGYNIYNLRLEELNNWLENASVRLSYYEKNEDIAFSNMHEAINKCKEEKDNLKKTKQDEEVALKSVSTINTDIQREKDTQKELQANLEKATSEEERDKIQKEIDESKQRETDKNNDLSSAKTKQEAATKAREQAQSNFDSANTEKNKAMDKQAEIKAQRKKADKEYEKTEEKAKALKEKADGAYSENKLKTAAWATAILKVMKLSVDAGFDINLAFFDSCVGGLAGDCRGQLVNCYTIGSVCSDFSDAKNSEWQYVDFGSAHSGRLVGRVRTGQSVSKTGKIVSANQLVVNCYYYGGTVKGNKIEAEGYGTPCLKDTNWDNKRGFDMRNPLTYTGFDFTNVWKVKKNKKTKKYVGYPELVTRFDNNDKDTEDFARIMKTFDVGDGSEENPFIIRTEEQFLEISELRKLDYYYKLEADLDLTGYIDRSTSFFGGVGYGEAEGNGPDLDFDGDAFAGHFDGNGHKITFVEKKEKAEETGGFYAGGLFPVISGSVKNLEVGCNEVGSKSRYHGLLAGRLLSGAVVENVSVTSDQSGVISGGVASGGIIGCVEAGAVLRNCSLFAPDIKVNAEADMKNGLGKIYYNGVFVGENKGTAEYLCGVANPTVEYGLRENGGTHNVVYVLKNGEKYSENSLAGLDFNHIWSIDKDTRKPVLRCLKSTEEFDYDNELIIKASESVNGACITGRGTAENPYIIRSAADFKALLYAAEEVNKHGQTFSGVYFQQAADFELERGNDIPQLQFGGNYNGAGYKITIRDNYDAPIFSSMNGAVFRNCILESKKLDAQTNKLTDEPFTIAYGANNCLLLNCQFGQKVGVVKTEFMINVNVINCIYDGSTLYLDDLTNETFNGSIVGLEDADERVGVNNYDIRQVSSDDYRELNNMTGVPKELKNQIYPWQEVKDANGNGTGIWHMVCQDFDSGLVYFDLGEGVHINSARILTYTDEKNTELKFATPLLESDYIKNGSEIVGVRAPQGTELMLEVSYDGDAKTADYVMVTSALVEEKPNLVDLILALTGKNSEPQQPEEETLEVDPFKTLTAGDYQSITGSIGTLTADTGFISCTVEASEKTISLYKKSEPYKAVPVLSRQYQGADIEKVRFYYTERIFEEIEAGKLKIENYDKDSTDLQNIRITVRFKSSGVDGKIFDNVKIKLNQSAGWFNAESIALSQKPDKLYYLPGQKIDLKGAKFVLNEGKVDEHIKPIEELFSVAQSEKASQYCQNSKGKSDGIHAIVLTTPSSYTIDELGEHEVKFIIDRHEFSYDIEVVRVLPVKSIRITQAPSQTSIIGGGQFSLAGGMLEVTYNSNIKVNFALEDLDGVNYSIGNPDESGKATVTVEYSGCSDTFEVDYVSKAVDSIEMYRYGKRNYLVGEELAFDSLELLINYNDGTSSIKTLKEIMSYGGRVIYDTRTPLAPGKSSEERTCRVIYQGKEITFKYTVSSTLWVKQVEVTKEPTCTQYKGSTLNLTGGELRVTYNNDTYKSINMNSVGVTATCDNMNQLGEQTVNVVYEENETRAATSFTITVVSGVESIAINTAPTRTIYPLGVYDQLIPDGGTITVNYKEGYKQNIASEVIPLSEAEITGFNSNTVGTKTVQVNYEGATASFNVNVYDFDILNVQPSAGNMVAGTLIPALKNGASFVIKYSNNSTETVNMEGNEEVTITSTDYSASNVTLSSLGEKEFTVYYGSKTKSFKKLVQALSISTANTPSVIVLDKTGAPLSSTDWGDINVYGLNGLIGQVSITEDIISNLSVGDNKSITVSYDGATAQFTVDVKKIDAITLPQNMETEHQLGETVKRNETANQITVTYTDNTTATIPMTDSAVSITMGNGCLDANGLLQRLGSQQVTVSYGGASANYNINVKAQRIEIVQSPKTKYLSGDRFSIEGGKIKVYGANNTVFGTFDFDAESVLGSAVTFKKGNDVLTTESKLNTNSGDSTTETQIDVYCGGVSASYDVTILNSKQNVGAIRKGFVQYGARNTAFGPTMVGGVTVPVLYVKNNGSKAAKTRKAYIEFDMSGAKEFATSNGLEIESVKVTFKAKNRDGIARKTKISVVKGTWPSKLTWYTAGASFTDKVFMKEVTIKNTEIFEVNIPLVQLNDQLTLCFEGKDGKEGNRNDMQYIYCDDNLKCEVTYQKAKDIQSISDITGYKNKYMTGASLDTSQGSFKVTYTDGEQKTMSFGELGASAFEYDFSTVGSSTVSINYGGKSASFDVTVVENGISAITGLSETEFLLGQPIESEYINVKYNDHTVGTVQISDGVDVSGYNAETPGTQRVILSYGGRLKSVDVTVMAAGLEWVSQPTKTNNYYKGEALDLTGGVIRATGFDNGTEIYSENITLVDPTDSSLADFITVTGNTNTVGTREITVSYGGKSVKFNVEVVEPWVTEITDISSETFILGEDRESTRKTITVKKINGSESRIQLWNNQTVSVSDVNSNGKWNVNTSVYNSITSSLGEKQIKVTYSGKEKVFTVNVNASSISVTAPSKIKYLKGTDLDLTGGKVTANGVNGLNKTVNMTSDMVSGYEKNRVGTQTLTVTYGGKTKTFNVEVVENGISEITGLSRTGFLLGQPMSNEHINVKYNDGSVGTVQISEGVTVSGYNADMPGTQTVQLSYGGKQKSVDVTVALAGLEWVSQPTKTSYYMGEALDLTGGVIKATGFGSGPSIYSKTISLKDSVEAGFITVTGDTNTVGQKEITVTYGGRSVTFYVTVEIEKQNVSASLKGYIQLGEKDSVFAPTIVDGMTVPVLLVKNNLGGGKTRKAYVQFDLNGCKEFAASNGLTIESVKVKFKAKNNKNNQKTTRVNTVKGTWPSRLTWNSAGASFISYGHSQTVNIKGIRGYEVNIPLAQLNDLLTLCFESVSRNGVDMQYIYCDESLKCEVTYKTLKPVASITNISGYKGEYKTGDSLDKTQGHFTVNYADGTHEEISFGQLADSQFVYDFNTAGSQKTVTINYGGKSKNFNVTVEAVRTITGIEIIEPTKKTYTKGEALSLTGGKVRAVYDDGSKGSYVDMTSAMVSGYDANKFGSQTLTVTYGGKTKTFTVEVVKSVIGIEIIEPTKKTYTKGEALSLTGGKVRTVYDDGSRGSYVDMTTAMVSGYNENDFGPQTLTVNYEGKSKTFTVELVKSITGIEIIEPTKKTYTKGEALSLTGGKVRAVYDDGSKSSYVDMTSDNVTISGYNENDFGPQTLTVNYEGKSKTFTVEVVKSVIGIEIIEPTKKTYTKGEALSLAGGKVRAVYDDGSKGTYVDMTSAMVSGYDASSIRIQSLTVTYEGKSTNFQVEVVRSITGIEIEKPTKTTYRKGEPLDLTGGKVRTVYDDGSRGSYVAMTAAMVSGYDANKLGPQTLTVTYEGKTKTFNVTVAELQVTGISINKKPTKLSYVKGQDLDLNGGEITVSYNDGSSQTKLMSDNGVTVNGYEKNSVGTQTVTVKYGTFSKYFDVTVAELQATGIRINKKPTKLSYVKGQDLDLSGGEITVSYNDGSTHTMSMSDGGVTVSDYNKDTVGAQRLTVTYGTFSKYFNVTVVAVQITGISIKEKPTKLSYVKGQDLDLSGGEITVSCNDGSTHTMSMSAGGVKVMYYNKDSVGTQTLTVTYGGWGANFNVTVAELQATGVSINKKPTKLSYVKGQDLDLSGGEITISYNDGSSQTKLMSDSGVTVSGYEKNSVGTQTLTVTYGEKTNTFSVEVVENGISEITGLSRTGFLLGQPMSNEHINVKYNDGSVGTVQISEGVTVSGYNADMPGTQTVQLSYGGKQKSVDVTVGLAGLVWISKPTKTGSYYKGEALDLTGGVIKATGFGSGSNIYSKEISLTDPMMAGFITVTGNTNTVGTREITVSYGGKSVKFNINVVEPWVTEILDISSIYFTLGESRTSTSKTIAVKKIDGCISFISLSNNQDVSVTDVNSNDEWNDNTAVGSSITSTVGQKRIKVTYSGKTKEFTVNVNASRISVEEPEKIQYARGDALDLTGGQITAYGENNVTQKVPMEIKHISGYDRYDLGSQQLTVTFGEQTTTFFVTVVKKVTGIEITPPTRTFYTKGEELSLTGGKVRAVYDDSSKSPYVAMIPEQVSGYDKNKLGPQTVTVIYEEKSKTFNVEVIDAGTITLTNPQAAFVNSGGSKQTPTGATAKLYVKNNGPNNKYTREAFLTFDLRRLKKILNDTGLEIKTARLKYKANLSNANAQHRLYLKGANEKASWNKWSNRPAMQNNAIASQLIKGTTMVSLNQTVTNYLKGKLNGNSATFGLCTEQYRTGEWFNIPLGSSMPTLVVETTKDQLTVKSIQLIQKPSKLKYAKGERDTLSLVGGQIKVTYSDNSVKEMPLNSEGITISGYNSQQVGSQNITISYGNKQLANAFTITVIDEIVVSKIRMNGSAEFTVKAGKAIDFTGRTMKVTYSDGSYQDIYIATDSAVTKPEPHTTKGDYIDIIQYGGGFVRIRVKVV